MDFGIGFLSNNVMLPILDFFFGIVRSYGFAIVALTLVVRLAVYPLSAKSIRSMRRTRITQPLMQKRVKEIQARYQNDAAKQQEAMAELYKEFGNPLSGCLPVVLQMPILFALFATLRGSPFSNVNYTATVQILPQEKMEQVQPQPFATKSQTIYVDNGVHFPIVGILPEGNHIGVGDKVHFEFQTGEGKSLDTLNQEYPERPLQPQWTITKGQERVSLKEDGTVVALEPGEFTLQGTIPGIAANEGFLFIKALGQVGVTDSEGHINWDILGMILFFGASLYVNQTISGPSGSTANDPQQAQQQAVNKITPVIFSGMFLFFPLPAGVLMYMTVANAFQTLQTFILMKEPLPENLQKLIDEQEKATQGRENLPFEQKRNKKKEKTS